MEKSEKNYKEILEEAQEKGYAEANTEADVEGWDARAKLIILTKLAYGIKINEKQIICKGITKIKKIDFKYAEKKNYKIKFIGISEKIKENEISIWLSPALIPKDDVLAQIKGVKNGIKIKRENIGESYYIGEGAGRYPTANSVIADLRKITELREEGTPIFGPNNKEMKIKRRIKLKYYIRCIIKKNSTGEKKIKKMLYVSKIKINEINYETYEDKGYYICTMIINKCTNILIEYIIKIINQTYYMYIKDELIHMPIIN